MIKRKLIMQINIEKRDLKVAGIVILVVLLLGLGMKAFNNQDYKTSQISSEINEDTLDQRVEEIIAEKIETGEIRSTSSVEDDEISMIDKSTEDGAGKEEILEAQETDSVGDVEYNNGTGAHYEASMQDKVARYEAGIIAEYGSLDEYDPALDSNHPLYDPGIIDQ